jgi:hypothetical protein
MFLVHLCHRQSLNSLAGDFIFTLHQQYHYGLLVVKGSELEASGGHLMGWH